MVQGLFPDPGPDGEEPDGYPLSPAAGDDGPEGDWDSPDEGLGQGLYVCLPAGQVTLAGFAQNGEADTMAPGPLLATVVDTVAGEDGAGLAGCSDDQLVGIISAARRLAARAEWTSMAAVAEFAARHGGSRPADEFAPDELAFELHLTPLAAAEQMQYASMVAVRLPATFAALSAGQIHPVHLRIIEDETRVLSGADAAQAEAVLAGAAPGMTFGELRAAAHKLVLKLDPDAARKRKEAAKREAQVRRFREASGNAGMVARELPCDEVLASWQHVEQRALDLRAAGMPGTLQELRVRAYLDLLQERDSRGQLHEPDSRGQLAAPVPAAGSSAGPVPDGEVGGQPSVADLPDQRPPDGGQPGEADLPDQPPPDGGQPGDGPGGDGPGSDGPDDDDGPGGSDGPGNGPRGPSGPGAAPAPGPGPAPGPSLAALVTITIPWATLQGQSDTPGEAGGFGPLDGEDARDLAAAAARHPATRWCLTTLNPDGTAAAHTCLPGRHPPLGTGPSPGPAITMTPVTRGPCDHAHAEIGYHPSRRLQHLICARSATCTAPGCRRPAAHCDLDHTHPWDQGGLTCECNLAPLCRHHHRVKQAAGWWLHQPEPGVLVWRVPSGRSYTTRPAEYSI